MVYDSVYNSSMNKYDEIIEKQLNEEYYDIKDLKYGSNISSFLSAYDIDKLYQRKMEILDEGNDDRFVKLDLISWDNKPLFFLLPLDLKDKTHTFNGILSEFSFDDSLKDSVKHSRIYSEIEGSLSIENVPTTHKRLLELIEENASPSNLNDIIVRNMASAMDFVMEKPKFNKENLFVLYSILSNGCLKEDDKLKSGELYRYDDVMVDHYYGCPPSKIEECMDSLFKFVNENLDNSELRCVLPHIAHYYVLYTHPYFDYNGRTARMVSLWIHILLGDDSPAVLSEAIDQRKKGYYLALENTRDSKNDLTYFFEYIYDILIDYLLAYKNIEVITQRLKNGGIVWTETEKVYFKKILISYNGKFAYSDFVKFAKLDMSKQGALKILNKFVSYGLLTSNEAKSKTKLFDINRASLDFLAKSLI